MITLSVLLFLIGISIHIIMHIHFCRNPNYKYNCLLGSFAILCLLASEILKRKQENYSPDSDYDFTNDYNSAYISGKIVGGTVYASYPSATPGLGWVN